MLKFFNKSQQHAHLMGCLCSDNHFNAFYNKFNPIYMGIERCSSPLYLIAPFLRTSIWNIGNRFNVPLQIFYTSHFIQKHTHTGLRCKVNISLEIILSYYKIYLHRHDQVYFTTMKPVHSQFTCFIQLICCIQHCLVELS